MARSCSKPARAGVAVQFDSSIRRHIVEVGWRREWGARELKRTILRCLTQPLAAMTANGEIPPDAIVHAELNPDGENLVLTVVV